MGRGSGRRRDSADSFHNDRLPVCLAGAAGWYKSRRENARSLGAVNVSACLPRQPVPDW